MTNPQKYVHILICTNQKKEGRFCFNDNINEICEYFKISLQKNVSRLNPDCKYKVVKTSCLGRCSLGPNILIYPDNIWCKYENTNDVDAIIEKYLCSVDNF